MVGSYTTRIVEAHIEEVPEEAADLEADTMENYFPHTPVREKAKKSDELSEEATDLLMDNNARAEDQRLKTAFTMHL